MLIARALQAFGLLALIGAAIVALQAREPVPARPSPSTYCEAMRLSEEVLAQRERRTPRPPSADCILPPTTRWVPAQLVMAAEAAVAALLLIGLGAGLADLRHIRERAEARGRRRASPASPLPPLADPGSPRNSRLACMDPPHDIAARVAVGHAADRPFSPLQIAEVADAVEGAAIRAGRELPRAAAEIEARRLLQAAVTPHD